LFQVFKEYKCDKYYFILMSLRCSSVCCILWLPQLLLENPQHEQLLHLFAATIVSMATWENVAEENKKKQEQ